MGYLVGFSSKLARTLAAAISKLFKVIKHLMCEDGSLNTLQL